MIAEYLTRRDAENYARELARHYGPDVHFDVVGMPDPVFGTCLALAPSMAGPLHSMQQERKEWRNASAVTRAQPRAGARNGGQRGELC